MKSYKFEITDDKMQSAIQNHLEKELDGSFSSNPIREAVRDALKENNEAIKDLVGKVIKDSINDPEFKNKLADVALSKIIEKGLK